MPVSYRKVYNKWHIRFRKSGGKEVTKSLPGSLKEKTVQTKAAWYEEQIALGRLDPWEESSPGLLLQTALEEYFAENKKSGNWSEKTYSVTTYELQRMFNEVLAKPIDQITQWQSLFDAYPGNHNSRRGYRTRVNAFLNWAADKGYIKPTSVELRVSDKKAIQNDDSVKYITWDQLDRVCQAERFLHRQNRLIYKTPGKDADFYPDLWWFMFYSLLRKSEVERLSAGDLTARRLTVFGKGRRKDIITLPPPAFEIAQKYTTGKDKSDPIFTTDMNRPYKHLSRAVELALGPDHHSKGFHQIRHGGIVHYLSLGKPLQFVSKLARHRSSRTTAERYADVIPERMDDVFGDVSHSPVK